jgi:hypothetical protein
MDFHILAVPASFSDRIRTSLRDDAGNALSVWVSDSDGNPCRSCLRRTSAGERLILCTYTPFDAAGPYAESGPIFLHADSCEPYDPASGFPEDFSDRNLTLRSYGSTGRGSFSIVDATVAEPGNAVPELERLFADPNVDVVHARNPAWGCYDFRVERSR